MLVSEYSIICAAYIVSAVHKDPKSRKDLGAVTAHGKV